MSARATVMLPSQNAPAAMLTVPVPAAACAAARLVEAPRVLGVPLPARSGTPLFRRNSFQEFGLKWRQEMNQAYRATRYVLPHELHEFQREDKFLFFDPVNFVWFQTDRLGKGVIDGLSLGGGLWEAA